MSACVMDDSETTSGCAIQNLVGNVGY